MNWKRGGKFSYWPLAVGRWLLAVGCWLLAVGCWPLAVGRWPLAVGRSRTTLLVRLSGLTAAVESQGEFVDHLGDVIALFD
jgi:hypothetical protein